MGAAQGGFVTELYKVEVHFELREDGGLRVWSPDVRGFRLSHEDPKAVIEDIIPALEGVLSAKLGKKLRVRKLLPLSSGDDECREYPKKAEYATELAA